VSGETEEHVSGWTVDTLHAHVEQQITDLRKQLDERHTAQNSAVQAALTSAEKAVGKAETAAERRFESVNEFRAQLSDQATRFVTRVEAETAHNAILDRITEQAKVVANTVPRAEWDAGHNRLIEQVKELNDRVTGMEGRSRGLALGWGYLVAGIGVVATIITIIIFFRV